MGPLLLKQSSPLIGEAKVLQLYKTDLDLDIYIYICVMELEYPLIQK